MAYMDPGFPLIKPQEFSLLDEDGKEHVYIISKFDAVAGREITAKYIIGALPKIGDYDNISEPMMVKLMSYVAVRVGDEPNQKLQRLGSKALIINHVPTWEMLARIEGEMMKYNCDFFRAGKISTFFEDLTQKLLQKISEISTQSSPQSSTAEKPAITTSEPSTT